MKWFNEHLNLTYTFIIILSIIISIVMFLSGTKALYFAGASIGSLLILGGSAWILYKKGQSLWFLLLVLVFSLALIVLALALPNKRTGQGEAPKINDADYYRERETGTK